jgi:Protein of unknown function (DUF1566)
MRHALRFSFTFIAAVVPLLCQPHTAESVREKEIQGDGRVESCDTNGHALELKDAEGRIPLISLDQPPIVVAAERFRDNGDGTVTDTRRKIMWQKGDNGKEVTFEEAQEYCKTLQLGGYADWSLPQPEEGETAVAIALMMPIHSPDTYARFDLYWSSDPTVLIPFNYRPSQGVQVSRIYPARAGGRAFVRAVRSLVRLKTSF